MSNPTVNRSLKDKEMDRIDHALGRPVDPMRESFRNYFATDESSSFARQFDASPFWEKGKVAPGGMAYFHVSEAGRAALVTHLKKIGDKHRLFSVSYYGYTDTVVGTSAGNAKYQKWLSVSDAWSDLTFAKFARDAKVRPLQMREATE